MGRLWRSGGICLLAGMLGGCVLPVLVPPTPISGTHRVCIAVAQTTPLRPELAAEMTEILPEAVNDELQSRFRGLETKSLGIVSTTDPDLATALAAQRDRMSVVEHCDEVLGIELGGRDETGHCLAMSGAPSDLSVPNRECEHFAFRLQLLVQTPAGQSLADRRRQSDQWQITFDADGREQKGTRDLAVGLALDHLRPILREGLKTWRPEQTAGLTLTDLENAAHRQGDGLIAQSRARKPRPRWMREEDRDLRYALAGALIQWDDLHVREKAIADPERYRATREGETYKGSLAEMERFTGALIDLVTAIKEARRKARAEEIARPFIPRIQSYAEAGRKAEAYEKTADADLQYRRAEKGWEWVRSVYLAEGFAVPEEVPPDLWTPADNAVRGRIRCDHVQFVMPSRNVPRPEDDSASLAWPAIAAGSPIGLQGYPGLEALVKRGASGQVDAVAPTAAPSEPGILRGRCVVAEGKKCNTNHLITSSWNARTGTIQAAKGTYELDLAVPVNQVIEIFCDGHRVGTKRVNGATNLDINCD